MRRLADLTAEDWARACAPGPAAEPGSGGRILVGVAEADFGAVTADPSGTALLAYGDPGSGRTRFLTRVLAEAARWSAGLRPQVYVLDYLGALLDACSDLVVDAGNDLVVAAAYGPHETPEVLDALTHELTARQAADAAVRRNPELAAGVRRRPSGWSSTTTNSSMPPPGRASCRSSPISFPTPPASG